MYRNNGTIITIAQFILFIAFRSFVNIKHGQTHKFIFLKSQQSIGRINSANHDDDDKSHE